MKQCLWHLENQFTMMETIQLKPLLEVLSLSSACTISDSQMHLREKQSQNEQKNIIYLLKQRSGSLLDAH